MKPGFGQDKEFNARSWGVKQDVACGDDTSVDCDVNCSGDSDSDVGRADDVGGGVPRIVALCAYR
jgi:hypothetical protein